MALSPQLLQFKSSGVYRLEFDKSQTSNINVETLRLFVGHSKKGPFNTPVLISNKEQFIDVFGNIDRNLEKLGMFFHRSVLAGLSRGPVLCLNLMDFGASDKADTVKLSTAGHTDAATSVATVSTKQYADFFDKEKFYTPSDSALLSQVTASDDHIINFVNIKESDITVITRSAKNVDGFEIQFRDWYGSGNVPSYVNEFDYVSDYMVDVLVFKGNFEPADLNTDALFGSYFTSTGLSKDKIDAFANLKQVSLIGQYTGSVIPGFKDLEGRDLYIESSINSEARKTGLFCAINESSVLAGNYDAVGHVYDAADSYEALSYDLAAGAKGTAVTFTNNTGYIKDGTSFTITFLDADAPATFELSVGNYVKSSTTNRMSKITKIAKAPSAGTTTYTVSLSDAADSVIPAFAIKSFEDAVSEYKVSVIKGATITQPKIADLLSVCSTGTSLGNTLVDKDSIEFRYIVDTFASYESANGILNKVELSQLAKQRQNASAILNAPSIADFKSSTDPSFKDANGSFDVNHVKTGGNLSLNPTTLYSLPGINDGANYAFYYGPGLLVKEAGKNLVVPPAAYVSNNFMDKYTADLPWSIVAGPRRGVVGGNGLVGAEYAFNKDDRDILEPFGINPIVFQRGSGLTILGNKTAQQSTKSALSSAHVREALIYIQDGIADILKDYVFELNTSQARLEIKTLVDGFLESIKQDGGVYSYKNIMDQSNNTGDVIDNNMGIVDTFVEPVKGLEVVVHRTTILNTGEIATGNFS